MSEKWKTIKENSNYEINNQHGNMLIKKEE